MCVGNSAIARSAYLVSDVHFALAKMRSMRFRWPLFVFAMGWITAGCGGATEGASIPPEENLPNESTPGEIAPGESSAEQDLTAEGKRFVGEWRRVFPERGFETITFQQGGRYRGVLYKAP